MKPINLIFASDENFLKYTAVTLASVLKNLAGTRRLEVFILTDRPLSPSDLEKMKQLGAIREFGLHNVIVDASQFAKIRTTAGITLATYFRLVMHDVLPEDMDRCLYMDSDIVVRKSLTEIYDIEMDGFLFAGVQDSISYVYNRKFGTPATAPHINAGVTLVNLKLAKTSSFSERVNNYLECNRYLITLGDQQIINGTFHEQIKYIHARWNVHGSMFNPEWRRDHVGVSNSFSEQEMNEAVGDPAVVHYTYKRKPWISDEHPRSFEWWTYAALTPFFADRDKRSAKLQPASKLDPADAVAPPLQKGKADSFMSRLNGYLKSIAKLRETRLTVQRVDRTLQAQTSRRTQRPNSNPLVPYYLLEDQSASVLGAIGSRPLPTRFDAREVIAGRKEYAKLLTNAEHKDLDGGFHENLKTILKTPTIRRDLDLSEVDGVLVLIQRLRQDLYWKVLYAARYYDKDLLFAETTFFGAFATYFDEDAPPLLRKSFGYILDDKGYYFDARNPSRLESYLNSNDSILSTDELGRSQRLIAKIVANGITKYNFSSKPVKAVNVPSNSVLVVDQKSNDASIEFAAATDATFGVMIKAALDENPGASILLKPHPDNLGKNRHLLDPRVRVLPDDCRVTDIIDHASKVYVVSSQVGFEAILRGKEVHCFGIPFYAGWGLTVDRQSISRRTRRVSAEELFHAACIRHSVYLNPTTGKLMEIEDALDFIIEMRNEQDVNWKGAA